jgi:hypothetical protein
MGPAWLEVRSLLEVRSWLEVRIRSVVRNTVRGIGGRITHPQDTSTFLYPRNIRPCLALAAAHVTITSPCRPTAGWPSLGTRCRRAQACNAPCRACRERQRTFDAGRYPAAGWSNRDDKPLSWRQMASVPMAHDRSVAVRSSMRLMQDHRRSNRFASTSSAEVISSCGSWPISR